MKRKILLFFVAFLMTTWSFGQITTSTTYDLTDGVTVANGQSTDGNVVFGGSYSEHGYGLNMKESGTISITVGQSSTIRFTSSTYSNLEMVGTATETGDLGTQNTYVTVDKVGTVDFCYSGISGTSKTLIFTFTAGVGADLYCPKIEVIPATNGGESTLTAAEENVVYYFDLRDGSIIPTSTDGSAVETGLFSSESGSSTTYKYNGSQHGVQFGSGNTITLDVAGNSYIKVGNCAYGAGTFELSSTSGAFNITSATNNNGSNYAPNGVTTDILYVGDAGQVVITFSATTYVPYIEVVPVPYEVSLASYVQKTGTITLNGVEIEYTAGADASTFASVTVSEGTVVSATNKEASIYINLGGNSLSSLTPTLTGDIESVDLSNNESIEITLADADTEPYSYSIKVVDSSIEVNAEAGGLYTYSFADGSEFPQISVESLSYDTFYTSDQLITINSNATETKYQFGYHDSTHGASMFPGNSMDIKVAGNAIVSIIACQYGSVTDAQWVFTNASGDELGAILARNPEGDDEVAYDFVYQGDAGVITATLTSASGATSVVFVHGLSVQNAVAAGELDGKTAVWDFGAAVLDEATYINRLDADAINAWYSSSITPGSSSTKNLLPSFSADELSFVGGGNDRLRTTNTALTRYDEKESGIYTGQIYINSSAATGRYLGLSLKEDDQVIVVASSQNGQGLLNFINVADPAAQTDVANLSTDAEEYTFVAKTEGSYRIYDTQDKPSYYRVYRSNASYCMVSGSMDETEADGIPSDYSVVYENEAGKTWTVTPTSGSYAIELPVGYSYKISLADANGYIVSSTNTLSIADESVLTNDIAVKKVVLNTLSGNVVDLGDALANLSLQFVPVESTQIYMPEVSLDNSTGAYSVQLEPNVAYDVVAEGVNDYQITSVSTTIEADETNDIVFEAKPVYSITITSDDLTTEQLGGLELTFSNLNEEGYSYTFSDVSAIALRDGVYTVAVSSGLDAYPLALGLTSNLKVSGGATSKSLSFVPVTEWTFGDKQFESTTYNGLTFSEAVKNEVAKSQIGIKNGVTVTIPITSGQKLVVEYYYAGAFTINGEAEVFATTSATKVAEYVYEGTGTSIDILTQTEPDGDGSAYTTWFKSIKVVDVVPFAEVLTVGTDKNYQTITDAMTAISLMDRLDDNGDVKRVTVMIDPGNYEEMLDITEDNVTFTNAASSPSIALANKGVDIDDNAVRITSYYGHGYNYYSQQDQKWNADALRVNTENGYISYENQGGTTNGSYWNATVVVYADGFIANNIIFENSFNQYISKKESEDTVVEWVSGGKGTRPVDYGDTSVQGKSFIERAAALALSGDQLILNNCRLVGRQDVFYGAQGSRAAIYKGNMMGGTDYIFGGMTATFYRTDIALNTSEDGGDIAYITAGQQDASDRGYLFYECTITSAIPGVDNAATYRSKPGYWGRCWSGSACEVLFYNTTIETSNNPSYEGLSLIDPEGWKDGLGGPSWRVGEYGTIEVSNVDNSANRLSGNEEAGDWGQTVLTVALTKQPDQVDLTTYNFTKGTDSWDPIPTLIANDTEDESPNGIETPKELEGVQIYVANSNQVFVNGLEEQSKIQVYNTQGMLVKSIVSASDVSFGMPQGYWIVRVINTQGLKTKKVITF